ncbi:hypothetical protein C0Q70_03170 [Pomacea canaliculata]|uniref:Sushi domain-containing protein n=1 Tax=Pomacea canaliculata TaxID=400727 RepID=A0A2T7PRZ6_POMCA|nr:hypothetical protein C0Q70_03170 [Pomacea canaliculata]
MGRDVMTSSQGTGRSAGYHQTSSTAQHGGHDVTRRQGGCPAIKCSECQNILPVLGPEAVWTTCAEPAPVANTYRNVTQSELGNDINYTCYSSYTHKEGDLDRRCQATGQYSGTPPTCGRELSPPAFVLTDDEGGIAFTLCEDEYPTESSSSGEREITCSADLGRWQPLVFYCGKILDLHNISLSSTLTTGTTGWVTQEEVAPEWEAGLAAPDARELYDVDETTVRVTKADYSEGDSLADAVLTVTQTGGSFGECGNVTTSTIERLYLLKCDTRQGRKPWGHSIKVTARFLDGNPGRLELRDVSVQGRVHAGELALSGWGRVEMCVCVYFC